MEIAVRATQYLRCHQENGRKGGILRTSSAVRNRDRNRVTSCGESKVRAGRRLQPSAGGGGRACLPRIRSEFAPPSGVLEKHGTRVAQYYCPCCSRDRRADMQQATNPGTFGGRVSSYAKGTLFRNKPLDQAIAESEKLRSNLNAWDLVGLGVGTRHCGARAQR